MYTYTHTYIHTFLYIYIYILWIFTHRSHGHVSNVTFVYLNTYWLSPSRTLFGERIKWFSKSKYREGGQGHNNLNCQSKKRLFLGDLDPSKFVKNPRKHLLRLASDSPKKFAGWRRQFFSHRKIPGSLPIPITVSELWEWLFPFPSHNSLWEVTSLFRHSHRGKMGWEGGIYFYYKMTPPPNLGHSWVILEGWSQILPSTKLFRHGFEQSCSAMATQKWGKGTATRWGCRIRQNWLQEPIEGTWQRGFKACVFTMAKQFRGECHGNPDRGVSWTFREGSVMHRNELSKCLRGECHQIINRGVSCHYQ